MEVESTHQPVNELLQAELQYKESYKQKEIDEEEEIAIKELQILFN